MDPLIVDAVGLKCPQPVLRLAVVVAKAAKGALVEISGDCPTFEPDVRSFCERSKATFLAVRRHGTTVTIQLKV